jgi:thioredoxin reductase
LERIRFEDGQEITRHALFVNAPTFQRSDLAAQFECRILEDGAVEVDELGQSTVPGVYAVGDMARRASQEPDLTFAARAMGDGVITGLAVNRELFFESVVFN